MSEIQKVGNGAMLQFNESEEKLLRDQICKGASTEELSYFMSVCGHTHLSPFKRQIFAVFRWDKNAGRKVMSIQTSVDGLRLIAERSGKYLGQTSTMWCGQDGKWVDIWTKKEPPFAAKVGVWKEGHKEPTYAVARFLSYCQDNNYIWKKMPDLMIAKCAESLALRKAFPNETHGLYTNEEMGQADNKPQPPRDATPPAKQIQEPQEQPRDVTQKTERKNHAPVSKHDQELQKRNEILTFIWQVVRDSGHDKEYILQAMDMNFSHRDSNKLSLEEAGLLLAYIEKELAVF